MSERKINLVFLALMLCALGVSITLSAVYSMSKSKIPHYEELNYPQLFTQTVRPLKKWTKIVLHHSAQDTGSMASIDLLHRQEHPHWNGIAYHFVIGNGSESADGSIEPTHRWPLQEFGTATPVTEVNQNGIAICLVGNFEVDYPTRGQLLSLSKLIDDCCLVFDIPREQIYLHKEISSTLCPGANFPVEMFRPSR